MADLPPQETATQPPEKINVTNENALPLAVHFLSKIYGRLGYIIKLLEEKK